MHEAHVLYAPIRVRALVRSILETGSTPQLDALTAGQRRADPARDVIWRVRDCKVCKA